MLLAIENPEKFLIIFIALAICATITASILEACKCLQRDSITRTRSGGFLFAGPLPAVYIAMAR